jgi:hypothetical protein
MRRITLLLMLMAIALLAASGVAWAVTKTCFNIAVGQTSPLNVRRIGGVTMAENHASWSPR